MLSVRLEEAIIPYLLDCVTVAMDPGYLRNPYFAVVAANLLLTVAGYVKKRIGPFTSMSAKSFL